jgi:hypothetical protein
MTQHTPEPWAKTFFIPIGCYHIQTNGGKFIGSAKSAYDASRIVACVNACAGIATQNLEAESLHQYSMKLVSRLAALEQQRDELLRAAKNYMENSTPDIGHNGRQSHTTLFDAIAKAQGVV